MRRFLSQSSLLAFLVVLCSFCACIDDEEEIGKGEIELAVGDTLPDFTVQMMDGTSISKEDLKDTCAVIVFFHTQCPDCQEEFPILQRLYDERPYPFKMLCISRKESATSIETYWKENGLTLPYSAQEDATIYHLFASSIIPRIYISDKEGRIRAIYTDHPIATYEDLCADLKKVTQH